MPYALIAGVVASALASAIASRNQAEEANMNAEATKTGGKYAYPGQKSIAKALTPYLWENLNVGLSESEKQLYRGEARTSVLQSLKGTSDTISKTAASQGLKGGSIAGILGQVESSKYPAFAQIETGIMKEDIAKKNKSLEDILKFLNMTAGYGEEANFGDLYSTNPTITDIINKLIAEQTSSLTSQPYYNFPDVTSAGGFGGGDAGAGGEGGGVGY